MNFVTGGVELKHSAALASGEFEYVPVLGRTECRLAVELALVQVLNVEG